MVALFFEDFWAVSTNSMQEFYLARASISVIVTKAIFYWGEGLYVLVGNVNVPMPSYTAGVAICMDFFETACLGVFSTYEAD